MRTFIILCILLCFTGGAYLLSGVPFFMPSRHDPHQGVLLYGITSQMLGAGLWGCAGLGLMIIFHANRHPGRLTSVRWQQRFFLLLSLTLILIMTAFIMSTPGKTPAG